ncbi:hypothetical protein H0N95_02335 [Candidatus Micrarchaeota archaeon]|nr:hypothetical protein [Candidatus Micrarchaeota archaeon]
MAHSKNEYLIAGIIFTLIGLLWLLEFYNVFVAGLPYMALFVFVYGIKKLWHGIMG